MKDSTSTRRRFLTAAIAFSGIATGTLGPAVLRFGAAWAQSGDQGTSSNVLVRMARLLLPHDAVADDVYAETLNDALAATADDSSIAEVEALLDAQQSADFIALDEEAQLAAMRAIENSAPFAAVLAAVKTHLYGHPAVWKVINYEGPSYQDGGYLNRGAGEIDWLPEAD